MVTFKSAFFVHVGYLTDLVIISICIFGELKSWGSEIRLLNFLRVWRLLRLVNSMSADSRADQNDTLNVLQLEKLKTQQLTSEKALIQDSLLREVESRKRVEYMLRGYKDEVDTLSEALKIAALDVAEAARDELMDEDDSGSEGDYDEDGEQFFENESKGRKEGGQETFVIKSDGSYDKR